MSHERSDRVWQEWKQSSEKFDHLMAGISTAVTAYVGQHLEFSRIGINSSTLELVALAVFGGATYFSFRRIMCMVAGMSASHQRLASLEARGNIVAALTEPGVGPLVNTSTGDIISPATAAKRL